MFFRSAAWAPCEGERVPRSKAGWDPELLRAAVAAYERADWDTAERLFRSIHARFPDNARVQDYLDENAHAWLEHNAHSIYN